MKKSGFTLIELMIVVAIIAIIAAIAIPNLLRSRMSANEANAIGTLRTISTAEIQYQASGADVDATTNVNQFGPLNSLGSTATQIAFLDEALSSAISPIKSGYTFNVSTATGTAAAPAFVGTATPSSSRHGSRSFFVDESGVVRWKTGTTGATSVDDPL
jgi:type IV pilus assembly protein PilA